MGPEDQASGLLRQLKEQCCMKSQTAAASGMNLNHDEIAARAYQIWEGAGCPAGSEIKHWLQAEEELRAIQKMKTGQSVPKPLQKATGQSVDHTITETAKEQTKRQAESVPESSRRIQKHAAAA